MRCVALPSAVERWMLHVFVGAQIGVPAGLLAHRLLTGLVDWYGWGWQMYSVFR